MRRSNPEESDLAGDEANEGGVACKQGHMLLSSAPLRNLLE